MGAIIIARIGAGPRVRFFHEHYGVPCRMLEGIEAISDRMLRWPDKNGCRLA